MNSAKASSIDRFQDRTEWRLLTAAASQDAHVFCQLAQSTVDWQTWLGLADRHGLASFLFYKSSAIHDALPAEILATLEDKYRRNVLKSLFLTRELICLLACLDSYGLQTMPYKGVVMSELCYGDMAARQAGDIDLFVKREEVGRIKPALAQLGYAPSTAIPNHSEAEYIASGYEYSFDGAAGKNLLELQWALQPKFYATDYDMDAMFERAQVVEISGQRVKTPCAEDLLLILAIHGAKHVWERLIWLCDIGQILKREELNWNSIRDRAQEFGVQRILHVTLLLAERLVGSELPREMVGTVRQDHASQKLADELVESIAAGTIYEQQKFSYFYLMMRLRERPWDRMRFAARLAFTPGPGEWDVIRLPKFLAPLYLIVRMARVAARAGRVKINAG